MEKKPQDRKEPVKKPVKAPKKREELTDAELQNISGGASKSKMPDDGFKRK